MIKAICIQWEWKLIRDNKYKLWKYVRNNEVILDFQFNNQFEFWKEPITSKFIIDEKGFAEIEVY
jgi:hypothetical protein